LHYNQVCKMRLNNKVYRWIVEITLILIVISLLRLWIQRDVVSGDAPNISAVTLEGQYFDLYKHKTRPLLVYFWATWCPVCKLEQSNIESISMDYPVITIAMQSGDDEEISQFLKDEKLTFKVINDDSGVLSKKYNIRGVPVSFVINKQNEIEFAEVGYTTELGLKARLWWASLE